MEVDEVKGRCVKKARMKSWLLHYRVSGIWIYLCKGKTCQVRRTDARHKTRQADTQSRTSLPREPQLRSAMLRGAFHGVVCAVVAATVLVRYDSKLYGVRGCHGWGPERGKDTVSKRGSLRLHADC